ncbi:subtilisin-like protease SBT5.6 [Impatiens glandulifera]|uniref:subtilisin-like protease SBT5.6 n=1 Tax=Impatiens glandulifera TaxID=253017 RepID=UPI001FB14340|nr:subtilisin-like protease SBT5.6 [Impatiens glandulifera]
MSIIHTCGFLLILVLRFASTLANQHTYIVYFRGHSRDKTPSEVEDVHLSHIELVKGSRKEAKASLLYSYKKVINGFSAMLSPEEATQLSGMEGVASVIRTDPRGYELHTSRSWDFVSTLDQDNGEGGQWNDRLHKKLLRKAKYGQDLIVGVLDSGIWPESASFKDGGMEPVPSTWKGKCQTGTNFKKSHCNRKIIGAQYFIKGYEAQYGSLNTTEEYRSPRDKIGHGTHTASTIGGRRVHNVSAIGGFAPGTASGGVPLVRLAIYKVCWAAPGSKGGTACMPADTLAALDAAVNDGVHVMSMSIGSTPAQPYGEDEIAVGSLFAIKENIVSVCSAGNSGPTPSLIGNVAPWILTVAASSLDRDFPAFLVLGNGQKFQGQSATSFQTPQTHPLVIGVDAEIKGTTNVNTTGYCKEGTLLSSAVKGKIVLCFGEFPGNDWEVKQVGGAGVIQVITLANVTQTTLSPVLLPGIVISLADAIKVVSYARTNKNPTVTLFPGKTRLGGSEPAPQMAWFSSRGPNNLNPNILKPDITAPGLNILAAWSEGTSPTPLVADHRVAKYKMDSGTSMSCPHVSASVLLLKAIHPSWSSAALRSALMTTAGTKNNKGTLIRNEVGNEATPFDYGSGHIRPYRAVDPGLVYDATFDDYFLFLCSGGYDFVAGECPKNPPSPSDLNYPSLAISNLKGKRTVLRTVTNVGKGKSVYNVTVMSPTGYSVNIAPKTLYFGKVGEKKNFTVSVEGNTKEKGKYAFGWFEWKDGIHSVRSPIVVSSA